MAVLNGDSGNNYIVGTIGDDTLNGNGGLDTLEADLGNDTLNGGLDNDYLYGSSGNDVLDGGAGADILEGGAGDDIYIVDDLGDVAMETALGGGVGFLGGIVRVSTDSSGAQGNNNSLYPVFSADGTQVAFQSNASNLVAGDTNGKADIFVKNLSTGAVKRVSTDSSGAQGNDNSESPFFSADGTKVAFTSYASNLVAGDINSAPDIFVKNLSTGAVTQVSTDSSGVQGNNYNFTSVFSADGTQVAFSSAASNLVAGDTNNQPDIFIKNLSTGVVRRVSTDSGGTQGNHTSYSPVFSVDGAQVLFESYASNLVVGDTNNRSDIFVKNLSTGVVTRVSTDSSGAQGNNHSNSAVFSADGTQVAFRSSASNLVVGDTNNDAYDVFVKNLSTGVLTRVSTSSSGEQGNNHSYKPVFSADGMQVAFSSAASNLVAGDTNGAPDIFFKNLSTGLMTLVSTGSSGAQGDNDSGSPVFSADGTQVAFSSAASNLVAGDTNIAYDIFVKNIASAPTDAGGIDTVQSSITYTLGQFIENLTLTGTANINATGNSLANILMGNSGNNVLNGGTGTGGDMLHGGLGDDTFIVNHVRDVVFEEVNGGIDTVQSTLSHILRDNVENLILVGNTDLSGTGNNADNSLTGNNGNNRLLAGNGNDTLSGGAGGDTLNGGSGADIMFGGTGNDTFTVENADDTVTEFADEGFDTVNSFISYTLTAHVERLSLEGMENLNGFGNDLDNTLNGNNANNWFIGGLGNDTLQGKGGADTLEGGMGNDLYYVDNAGDIVTELANEGTDKVSSSISYTLAANVEQLFLTSIANLTGTGNDLNNVIYGNSGNNHLDGGLGDDSLNGGAGNDILVGGAGNDTLVGGAGNDVLIDSSIDDSAISSLGAYYLTQANNTLVNNLGGANGFGEQILPLADDGLEFVDLSSIFGGTGIKWGSKNYTGLYVDNNGSLNLDGIWDFYENLPVKDLHTDIISAFWADTDTRSGALTPTIGGNSLGSNSVYYDIDAANGVFTATWDDVGAYKLHTDAANAFQIQLIKRGNQADFDIVFRYEAINWTTADNFEGLPPIVASAGYSDSQEKFTYQLSASSDVNNMLALDEQVGNTGKTGVYVFNVRNGVISNSNDYFEGGDGADTLVGGVGNDTLNGGAGNDTYLFGLSSGTDLINNTDASDGLDVVLFDAGITADQVWLRHVNNDLEVSIIGTTNSVKVQDWYSQPSKRVDALQLADGKTLLASEVETLVSAMAVFTPPAIGQTSLTTQQHAALDTVIATSW